MQNLSRECLVEEDERAGSPGPIRPASRSGRVDVRSATVVVSRPCPCCSGVAVPELACRYTDLGEVRTGRGAGRVVWRDGSREPLPLDLAATRGRLKGPGLRLSLRFAF